MTLIKPNRFLVASILAFSFFLHLVSCSDEVSVGPSVVPEDSPDFDVDLENSLMVPISLFSGADASSRADDYQNGTSVEHTMDFDINHECFGIFFDDNDRLLAIKRLYKHSSLGSGTTATGNSSEYGVFAVAYFGIPESDASSPDLSAAYNDSVPSKVLVVLNGGRIYSKLQDRLQVIVGGNWNRNLSVQNFLDFTWKSSDSYEASGHKDQVIGINNYGHYCMTNSAFYDSDLLRTVVSIDKDKVLPAFAEKIKPNNAAAVIFVERMVAKFSAPVFKTEVIGSKRVFRPSETAEPVVIYSWNTDGSLLSSQVDWRIHVLGWTINGRETENYLFKHIIQAHDNGLSGWSDWNDTDRNRSYWSIDPHYDRVWDGSSGDFYPWQYRGAVDRQGISWSHHSDNAVLRYLSFNDNRYWDDNSLTISENTFDPTVYRADSPDVLDSRASCLAGPHLLVTAELYIQSDRANDDDYMGQFITVDHLYSDRLRRFYLSEMDWFRMFVREFDQALTTQEIMSFDLFDWSSDEGGTDSPDRLQVTPSGKCALLFDLDLLEASVRDVPEDMRSEACRKLLAHRDEFNLRPVSEVIDLLIKYKIPVSIQASVKDGDGRLIPWIDGLVFRNKENTGAILPVKNLTTGENYAEWDDNKRKSLIFEWFGAIDHYNRGYMYYAHDIPHHVADNGLTYYGSVRNHWYSFTVNSINSLGNPIDDPDQPIIPARFNYRDQIGVYVEIKSMHPMSSNVEFE